MNDIDALNKVKAMKWFYEFELPDGSKTVADYPPDILKIHMSRLESLRRVLENHVVDAEQSTAGDLSSHEGFFSFELAANFSEVTGYEFRADSISNANLMKSVLDVKNVRFEQFDIQKAELESIRRHDFILMYGLLYHMENPIHSLRIATTMARKHILIDTQIFPYDISGPIEDSAFMHQRKVEGIFALTQDYSAHREGGSTDFALVPSLNALQFLLRRFGFDHVEVIEPRADDYEQFRRKMRVIVYARR